MDTFNETSVIGAAIQLGPPAAGGEAGKYAGYEGLVDQYIFLTRGGRVNGCSWTKHLAIFAKARIFTAVACGNATGITATSPNLTK